MAAKFQTVFAMGLLLAAAAVPALAHQVPSMVLEAEIRKDGQFLLKINFDPRLVVSAEPTTLPPMPGSWYDQQSEAERTKAADEAKQYLARNLAFFFGTQQVPQPAFALIAIDGTDNKAVRPDSTEVHYLATATAPTPAGAESFSIKLGDKANVSLIALIHPEGTPEPTPRVVFAGETSQPVAMPR